MKNFIIKSIIGIGIVLGWAGAAYAAPSLIYQKTILPEITNTYDLGSTSAQWLGLYVRNASTTNASTTNLFLIGQAVGCAQVGANGLVTSTGVACGSGSGSGTTTWLVDNGLLYTATSTDGAKAAYFIATSTTGTSTFAGKVGIGTTTPIYKLSVIGDINGQGNYIQGNQWLSLQQNGFGSGFHMAQFATSSNDVTGVRISNMSTGSSAGTGYILTNNNTTLNVAGLAQSYYGGLFMFGSNFNGAPFGITAVGPNDIGLSNTDGKLVLSAASSTGSIDFYAGSNGYVSGTMDMRLTSLGNFGIGSTTASAKLTVQGTSSAPTTDLVSVASSSMASFFNIKSNGRIGIATTTPIASLALVGAGGVNPFVIASSTGAQLLTLLQNGNLGIGSTTATAKLTVQGTSSAPTTDLVSVASSSMASFFNIKSNGRIGISTTTPIAKLSVKGDAATTGLVFATADSANLPRWRMQDNGNTGLNTAPDASIPLTVGLPSGSNGNILQFCRNLNSYCYRIFVNVSSEFGIADNSNNTVFGNTTAGALFTGGNMLVNHESFLSTTPLTTFEIYSDLATTSLAAKTSALPNSGNLIYAESVANGYTPGLSYATRQNNGTIPKWSIFGKDVGGAQMDLWFGTSDAYATGITNQMVYTGAGRLGIGSTTPSFRTTIKGAAGNGQTPILHISSSTDATLFSVNGAGHMVTGGGTPAVSSCGTSPTISGNDTAGTITVGTGVVTACTITFSTARANTPRVVGVVVGGGLNITGGYSAKSTSAVTFSFAATVAAGTFDYYIVE